MAGLDWLESQFALAFPEIIAHAHADSSIRQTGVGLLERSATGSSRTCADPALAARLRSQEARIIGYV